MKRGAVFLGVLLLALIVVLWLAKRRGPSSRGDELQAAVQTLTRQAARWSTAAKQDANPLIAVLHANYGAGYLWALNDIVTSAQFAEMTGLDYLRFRDAITAVQDQANRRLIAACPNAAPPDGYLARVAGEA